jgi:formiminotetrahydrofolate cyclodeaminase
VAHESRRSYVEAFALFDESAPLAGGAAAAAGAALGFAVLASVVRDARGPSAGEIHAAALRTTGERLLRLADEDSLAYDGLVTAFRMPRVDRGAQDGRRSAIDAALKIATGVPLAMMHACVEGLRAVAPVAAHAPARARGEIAVGLELVRAGCRGAAICVAANVASIRDESFVSRTAVEQRQVESEADAIRHEILRSIGSSSGR